MLKKPLIYEFAADMLVGFAAYSLPRPKRVFADGHLDAGFGQGSGSARAHRGKTGKSDPSQERDIDKEIHSMAEMARYAKSKFASFAGYDT